MAKRRQVMAKGRSPPKVPTDSYRANSAFPFEDATEINASSVTL